MKKGLLLLLIIFFSNISHSRSDDEDLFIFGSMQAIMLNQFQEYTLIKPYDSLLMNNSRTTFAVQQLDFFFSKNFERDFSLFIDLSFELNYSSENDWGSFNLEEAWINYNPNDYFNLKTGLLYPKFNNLNEIKNRLAILPFIIRPVAYESILSGVMHNEDIIPEHAYIQASGFVPISKLRFEYAAYIGNAEKSFISTNKSLDTTFEFLSGVDQESWDIKLVGGRIGLRDPDETFKFGLSATYDVDDRLTPFSREMHLSMPKIGKVPRYRLGSDLTIMYKNFELTAEVIEVLYDYKEMTDYDIKMGQRFYYANLLYNLASDVFVYGHYLIKHDDFFKFKENAVSVGAGVELNHAITAKIQFVNYNEKHDGLIIENNSVIPARIDHELYFILVGLSVLF